MECNSNTMAEPSPSCCGRHFKGHEALPRTWCSSSLHPLIIAGCVQLHPSIRPRWMVHLAHLLHWQSQSQHTQLTARRHRERDKCHAKLNIDSVLSLRPVLCPSDFVTPGNLNPIPELSGIPYNDDDQGGDRARQWPWVDKYWPKGQTGLHIGWLRRWVLCDLIH